MFKEIIKIMKTGILFLIKGYQMTRAIRPSCCRFYPSCSDYSAQAIEKYGVFKGLLFTLKRVMKCHPWHQGGIDAV